MSDNLRARIAAALGWTERDTQGFSLPSLLLLVRPVDPGLAQELATHIEGDYYIEAPKPRRRY
jgi:hypothetical protein